MKEFIRRFRRGFGVFLTEWVGPGMVGFAPMLLPIREILPEKYLIEQNLYYAQLPDPRQPIPPDRPLRMVAVEDQN